MSSKPKSSAGSQAKPSGKSRAKASTSGAKGSPPAEAQDVAKVSIFGMAKLVKAFHDGGHEAALNAMLGPQPHDKTVLMDYNKLQKIKAFVKKSPDLSKTSLAQDLDDCDCEPNDPYCICFGNHSTFSSP